MNARLRRRLAGAVGLLLALTVASMAEAQGGAADPIDGSVTLLTDVLPDVGAQPGRQTAGELRARAAVELRHDLGPRIRLTLAGYAQGLLASRPDLVSGVSATARAAVLRPTELHVEYRGEHVELRVGASRVVWGRLDEFQPSDVVNPLDVSRFLLDGRSDARLAVGLARMRVFLPRGVTVEGVLVPKFRRGRFDELGDVASPSCDRAPSRRSRGSPGPTS